MKTNGASTGADNVERPAVETGAVVRTFLIALWCL
jgi:hypothetical protein